MELPLTIRLSCLSMSLSCSHNRTLILCGISVSFAPQRHNGLNGINILRARCAESTRKEAVLEALRGIAQKVVKLVLRCVYRCQNHFSKTAQGSSVAQRQFVLIEGKMKTASRLTKALSFEGKQVCQRGL